MSNTVSRLAVAAAGLPVVLGAAWLGGWWMWLLLALAVLLALHELYAMTRQLRPLVLAGYIGALAALLGVQLGGVAWLGLALLLTLVVAFLFAAIADTSQSNTIAIGATVLGVAWIAVGLTHLALVRDVPGQGRQLVFTVLLTVFATDTGAYVVGRLVGRRKLAPRLSPGKTWEGFLGGTVFGVFVCWISLYQPITDEGFLSHGEAIALGLVVVVASVLGDLLESMVKRDMGVKDTGRLLGGHGGVLDRIDSLLVASPAAFYALLAFDAAPG